MPITLSDQFTTFASGLGVHVLAGVAANALFTSVSDFFANSIRPALNWGEDHTITWDSTDEFGNQVTVHFTVNRTTGRVRRLNDEDLGSRVLPGMFAAGVNQIANTAANLIGGAIQGVGDLLG